MDVTQRAKLYGFGSYFIRRHANKRDVDLLLLHLDTGHASIRFAICCKSLLVDAVTVAHIVMLSEQEELELGFVRQCQATFLGLIAEREKEKHIDALAKRIARW
jgi:hypothetical protein